MEAVVVLPEQDLKPSEKSKLDDSEPAKSEVLLPAIRFPKFDTSSPSQAVFRPQWLGVGFGASGVRARGVQSRARGPSSPLSTHRKPATDENENKVVLNKQKQKGKLPLSCIHLLYFGDKSVCFEAYYFSLIDHVISELDGAPPLSVAGKTLIGEGRSPLQILKETNSPRKNTAQVCPSFLVFVSLISFMHMVTISNSYITQPLGSCQM